VILLKLLGVWGWLKNAATAVFRAAISYPWQAGCIALALALIWAWTGWTAEKNGREADALAHAEQIAQIELASDENLKAAIEQVNRIEAESAQRAKDADNAHRIELADARAAADRYISANRVRWQDIRGGNPAPAPERDNPGIPDGLPARTDMVAISEQDLQACTESYTYALSAHNNAMDKIEAGVAIPDPEFGR